MSRRRLLAALFLFSILGGCGGQDPVPARDTVPAEDTVPARVPLSAAGVKTPEALPPVVLISIDTLRSDRLPIYGYSGIETPAIDNLAHAGIVFERAYCHTPLTLPSHVSILTGLLPQTHGVRDNQGYAFNSTEVDYLPRELKRLGYATGAAVSAYVLRGESGLAADFDVYEDAIELRPDTTLGGIARSGDATLAAIEPWLRSVTSDPFFLLFHLFEPHTPYQSDPPDHPYEGAPPGRRAGYAHPYDGDVVAADRVIGQLIELLEKLGVYDRALVVLLSDHGEGLGDHGELEHGILLYREALQVPLIVKMPAADIKLASGRPAAGSRIDTPAQLIDVLPTILEVVGAPQPEGLPGTSLLALPDSDASRRLVAETLYPRLHYGWSDLASVIEGDLHFIDGPDPELYDLASDPGEEHNLIGGEHRGVDAPLERRAAAELRRYLSQSSRGFEAPATVDKETREKLAALGYLGGATTVPSGSLPDPKAQLPTLDDLRRAATHVSNGDLRSAVPFYRKALTANPHMLDGWRTLGDVLHRLGDLEQALSAYARALELSGGDPEIGRRMAAGYERLGLSRLQQQAWTAARDASRRAVDLDPSRAGAWNNLGVALYSLGDREPALDAWERAIVIDPDQLDTLFNLGTKANDLGRREQARKALDRFVERAPAQRYRKELIQARVLLRRLES